MTMHEIEVWVMIDEAGDYAVGKDSDEATEAFENDIGGAGPARFVCLKVKVPAPRPVVVEVTVPDLPDDATVAVQE